MHQAPSHSNPADYGLTNIDVWKMQLKYLQQPVKEELIGQGIEGTTSRVDYYQNKILTTSGIEQALWQSLWLMAKAQQDKRLKRIEQIKWLLKNPEKQKQSFDIPYLKSIPINTLHEILPSGFFVHNPLRNEQSPSNSLHWNKNKNTWRDYANNTGGDVIDLVMAINNCDFIQACKILSNSG